MITPKQEAVYGKAMLALALREGQNPKRSWNEVSHQVSGYTVGAKGKIRAFLKLKPEATIYQVAEAVGIRVATAANHLSEMNKRGELVIAGRGAQRRHYSMKGKQK